MSLKVWTIIAGILSAIFVLILSKLWDPIAEYVGYPFDAHRRVENLVLEVNRLRQIEDDLLRLDPRPSSERCKGWMKSVQDLCLKTDKIKTGHDGCGPLNYFNKCYFAKEADMELKRATDLVGTGGGLLGEAQARPHAVRGVLPQHPHHQNVLRGMDSYKLKKVLDFIQDNTSLQSGLLGIWGMGGVGKTFLLEFVRDSPAVNAPSSFDHVLFVRAGRGATVGTMQKAIVATMGLPVMPDETSQEGVIYNHLKDKSFLLLIDDLWGYHELRDVGIPMPLGKVLCPPLGGGLVREYQRKVVFTTRSYDVCGQMACANNAIKLECLSKDDAWNLFVDKVGKGIISDPQLQKLAREIVPECSGLPLALCIIGQAMSTKKDPREWRCAIDLLKKSKLHEITKTEEELFERLKFSYDNMTNGLKKCFLICSLWAKDKNIPKEKLIEWWVGLGFLDASDSNPTYKGYSIINCLVNASMLEKGDIGLNSTEISHVKMHRVIRKMALWIANDHGQQDIWLPHSFRRLAFPEEKWREVKRAWVSSVDTSRWSSTTCCPNLIMLVSRLPFSLRYIPNFEEITFLDLEGTNRDKFPLEICALGKLQYLNLSGSKFDALPLELTRLSNLKYLLIRGVGALQTIPEGLISQLEKLQQLDLFCSGSVSKRVQFLPFLLEELVSETIDLFYFGITVHTRADIEKLERPRTVCTQALCMDQFEDERHPNKIDLQLLSGLGNVRELAITKSSVNQELVAEGHLSNEYGLLPYLDFLQLRDLFKLQKVTWENAGLNIRAVVIYNCTKLRHATWVQQLQSLEELTISYCPEMEQVIIDNNIEADQMAVTFRQLRKLKLENLPELLNVSEQGLPFEELSYVHVANCRKLKVIKVQERNNPHKIRIDCSQDWWTSFNQGIVNPLFDPEFCL